MTISKRAAAMGLLSGIGFAGGFMLSGVAREHSTLPAFRKADPGQLAKKAASALMASAAASATSGKDDGSAAEILSGVAAAGGAADGQGDGAEKLAISAKAAKGGGADGKDGAVAGTLALKAQSDGKTAPGDGAPLSKAGSAKDGGAGGLVSKAAASDAASAAAKAGASSPNSGSKATSSTGATPGGPCPMTDLAGAEAAAVLSGNTVDQEGNWGGHEFLHFSPRGMMGVIRPTTITARLWDPKAGVLCEGTVCSILHVRRCLDERASTGTAGDLQLANGRWAPILRGNVQGFPTYIPFLDEARKQPRPNARSTGAKSRAGVGDGAPFDIDRVYMAERAESGDDRRVSFYGRDGRVLDYAVPTADSVREGMTINLGWWTFQKGQLCQGAAGSASHPSCYQPKRQGPGRVTLTARDGQVDLVALADPVLLRSSGDD